MKIRIVTDSVSDLPAEALERWRISVVPTFVNYGGKSYADDGRELDRDRFYKMLPGMRDFPTTAAPPPALAEEVLREAAGEDAHVLAIHVPAKLSATLNNVRIGAQAALPQDRYTIIDSGTLTMAQGMQVLVAAEMAENGAAAPEIVAALQRVQQQQRLYAVIDTVEYLRRSGRVNPLLAALGTMLQIKPIVSVSDGVVAPLQRIRTFRKALERLRELVLAEAPLDRLVILHIQNEAGAREFLASLGDAAPPDTPIVEVGPTLGTHIGPGSVGATTLNQNWKR